MVEWQPIAREAFEELLAKEVSVLTPPRRQLYDSLAITPEGSNCFRTQEYGIECVFVVARTARHLLFFDDVEEEFAVGAPDNDGILRNWGLYGPLTGALQALVLLKTNDDNVR